MKKIISLIVITSLLLISCGDKKEQTIDEVIETQNLETIRQKRATIVIKQHEINDQIKSLTSLQVG